MDSRGAGDQRAAGTAASSTCIETYPRIMAAASRRRRTIPIGRSIDADFGREHRLKRLLTIGHSYVVAQNRRLAHEMAVQGSGEWEVTAVAPARLQGDLRHIELEHIPGEACAVVPLDLHLGSHPH